VSECCLAPNDVRFVLDQHALLIHAVLQQEDKASKMTLRQLF